MERKPIENYGYMRNDARHQGDEGQEGRISSQMSVIKEMKPIRVQNPKSNVRHQGDEGQEGRISSQMSVIKEMKDIRRQNPK